MSAALIYKQIGLDKPDSLSPHSRVSRKNAKENINANRRALLTETQMPGEAVGQICFDIAANERPACESRGTTSANCSSDNISRDSSLNSGKISEQNQASKNSLNSLNSLPCVDLLSCSTSEVGNNSCIPPARPDIKVAVKTQPTPHQSYHIAEEKNSSAQHKTPNSKRVKRKRKKHSEVEVLTSQSEGIVLSEVQGERKHTKKLKTSNNKVVIVESDPKASMIGKKVKGNIDGAAEAKELFEWMIHPVSSDQFFSELWEKKPLLVKRHNASYNADWFSTAEFSRILEQCPIQFGTHLDLTSYRDNTRQTHNQPGRAFPKIVWKHFKNGGSIRMLNPQTYSEKVWQLLSTLQDYFGSTMGANVYLTPPGTQGFAPHWDDIEAFLLQLEGKKRWRLYAPRTESETLPRDSSANLSQVDLGKAILDVTLEAGDLLYFPRGTIHQGQCLPDTHSLHITVSTYQKNTWGDLLEKLLPKALTVAMEEDVSFRQGLPLNYSTFMGVSKCDTINSQRSEFMMKIKELMEKLIRYAPVDSAADDMCSRFLNESMPPHPNRGCVSQFNTSASCSNEGDVSLSRNTITAVSRVRLATPRCARVLSHDTCVSLQHSCSNTRLIHEIEPQEIDYPDDYGPALEMLTNSYPKFVEVRSLPLGEEEVKVELVQELADMGILQVHHKDASRLGSLLRRKGKHQKNMDVKVRFSKNSNERPFSGDWGVMQRIDDDEVETTERKFRSLEREPRSLRTEKYDQDRMIDMTMVGKENLRSQRLTDI